MVCIVDDPLPNPAGGHVSGQHDAANEGGGTEGGACKDH